MGNRKEDNSFTFEFVQSSRFIQEYSLVVLGPKKAEKRRTVISVIISNKTKGWRYAEIGAWQGVSKSAFGRVERKSRVEKSLTPSGRKS